MNVKPILDRVSVAVVRLTAIGFLAIAVTACATAPSIESIAPFRQGVATASQQTSSAFNEVNDFLRRQQIERAVRQEALTEDMFFEALASEDLVKWSRAFAQIDAYAEKLERLLQPDQRSGVEEEIAALGQKIEVLREDQLPVGVATAFTRFGGFLVKMKSERDALAAIRKADPAVQDVFSAMIEAIGTDPDSGVRGTVRSSWRQILARIDVREFRRASGENAKRAAVLNYLKALDERDAQDRMLSSILLSLTTLAKSHQEIARGRQVSAGALIKIVQDEYKAYREQVEAARARRSGGSADGGAQ